MQITNLQILTEILICIGGSKPTEVGANDTTFGSKAYIKTMCTWHSKGHFLVTTDSMA